MASYTANYRLTKVAEDDFYDPQVFNDNADIIDSELSKRSKKYLKKTATLTAAKWTGDTAPYTIAVAVDGVTATNDVQVLPADWTTEQAEAWAEAMILCGTQSVGALTLKAYGDKPTVNIPVKILIGDEVEEG